MGEEGRDNPPEVGQVDVTGLAARALLAATTGVTLFVSPEEFRWLKITDPLTWERAVIGVWDEANRNADRPLDKGPLDLVLGPPWEVPVVVRYPSDSDEIGGRCPSTFTQGPRSLRCQQEAGHEGQCSWHRRGGQGGSTTVWWGANARPPSFLDDLGYAQLKAEVRHLRDLCDENGVDWGPGSRYDRETQAGLDALASDDRGGPDAVR